MKRKMQRGSNVQLAPVDPRVKFNSKKNICLTFPKFEHYWIVLCRATMWVLFCYVVGVGVVMGQSGGQGGMRPIFIAGVDPGLQPPSSSSVMSPSQLAAQAQLRNALLRAMGFGDSVSGKDMPEAPPGFQFLQGPCAIPIVSTTTTPNPILCPYPTTQSPFPVVGPWDETSPPDSGTVVTPTPHPLPCPGPGCSNQCKGPDCPRPPPCKGPDCPRPPPCKGPDCPRPPPCKGPECPRPLPCEGPDCYKPRPPCKGPDCDKPRPPCKGRDCDKPRPPCKGPDCPRPLPCKGPECDPSHPIPDEPCSGPDCPPRPSCDGPGPCPSRPTSPCYVPLPCSAIQPFVPPGFGYASASSYAELQCESMKPVAKNEPACSVLDSLQRLGARRMRQLILASGVDVMFRKLSGYTLFAPMDAAFETLPSWFIHSLDTDEKVRQEFVRGHYVKMDIPLWNLNNEYMVLSDRPGGHRLRINVYMRQLETKVYTVDGSRILRGDILGDEGRIHLLDRVIMPMERKTIVDYLSGREEFKEFYAMLTSTSMLETFRAETPVTLFVPTNSALRKMRPETMKDKDLVSLHCVNGTHYSAGLLNGGYLMTNVGHEIRVGVMSDGYSKLLSSINGYIRVVKSDVVCSNGVIQVVDTCLPSSKKRDFDDDVGDDLMVGPKASSSRMGDEDKDKVKEVMKKDTDKIEKTKDKIN